MRLANPSALSDLPVLRKKFRLSLYYLPLEQQLSILESLISQAESALAKRPLGRLTVQQAHGNPQYIYRPSPNTRQYIRKTNLLFVQSLAQKEYEESFLRAAERQRKELLKAEPRSASFMYHALAAPYEKLSPERKNLVTPYVLPDAEYLQAFLNTPYEHKGFDKDFPVIETENGERVRSKSEKIIADRLRALGIPYLYEYPLILSRIGKVHPDFTLLDIRERILVLLEHFGQMLDPGYVAWNMDKVESYIAAGFIPGNTFLFTFEGGSHVLNVSCLDKQLKERFF